MEVKNIARCAFMAPDPQLMTVDFENINKHQKEHREFLDKANAAKAEPGSKQEELQKLRRQLFGLKQAVESTEVFENNKAGEVQLLEHRLNEALTKKKAAAHSGNLLAERRQEHNIQLLESELAEAKKEYNFAKQRSVHATRALRNFDGAARIVELQALLEKPLPDAKSANVPK
jgi:hypothetical protein